ncbi:MAG: hypothetical protein JOY51_01560 [Nevskia sp.]|nr:hypothetical protein [Nevskia sp.]
MNRAARLRIALAIAAVLILAGMILLPRLLDWRAGKAFAQVRQGDAESLVQMYLGYPSNSGACGTQLRWDEDSLGGNDGRCVREVRYLGRSGARVVGYSANAKVVSKYFDPAR